MDDERDPKQPYEIIIPDDIKGLSMHYESYILETTKGDFFISLNFLMKIIKRSHGKLTGQLERTRKHIISLD